MGRVDDGDFDHLSRLTSSGVVGRDFNIVGVGVPEPPVDVDVGGLVGRGRHLHGLDVTRCARAIEELSARRVPTRVQIAVGVVERDVDVVGDACRHVDFKVVVIRRGVDGQPGAGQGEEGG